MGGHLEFPVAAPLAVRGTVLVVPGRGETPAAYARFGRRLAADAYRVRVLPATLDPEVVDAALADAVDLPRPLVLIGADAGAALVAGALARQQVDAVVLAGLPGHERQLGGEWGAELDARTHCPVHREVLTGDAEVVRGSLAVALPAALLDAAYGSTGAVPHLILAGDADPLADLDALGRLAKALPAARLSIVRGAHHDVLNDQTHRSVAAEIVAFLEMVRAGTPLRPFVHAESSAW